MRGKSYEDFVAEVIRQLQLPSPSDLKVRTKLTGIRQPGEYEIDITIRFRLSGVLDFLLIVECKNWKRPVDRPVVQKFAQTRDAVAAHKGVIVSPVGFTREACAVAKAHGVALWVLAHGTQDPHFELYYRRPEAPTVSSVFSKLRESLLDTWLEGNLSTDRPVLLDFNYGLLDFYLPARRRMWQRLLFFMDGALTPFVTISRSVSPAVVDLLNSMYLALSQSQGLDDEFFHPRIKDWQMQTIEELIMLGLPEDSAKEATHAAGENDLLTFSRLLEPCLLKTIKLEWEAYRLLYRHKREGQSLSQVIKEHFAGDSTEKRPGTEI